jgi:hypothetical protein
MNNNINVLISEELNKMKNLMVAKAGVVISEQDTAYTRQLDRGSSTSNVKPINQNDALARDRNWTNDYNCVRKIPNVTTQKLKDTTTVYINKTPQGNFIYYNNGGLKTPKGKMAKFKCDGDKVIFDDTRLWKLPEMSCVTSQTGATPRKLSDGSTVYQIGKVIYYNTNRKKLEDGTMTGYTCDTEFKTDKSVVNNNRNNNNSSDKKAQREKITLQNQNTVKEIQKSLNLPESGTLDSQSIEKLIGFLSNEELPKVQSVNQLIPAGIKQPDAAEQLRQIASQQTIRQ